ncbi:MAG: hypothetical protein COB54_01580 [Alphaproteobacteria bacterium]|nr:MAG: hypothetical protein COB54_01580 [Alphaproteobacteria bacterium]
MLKENEYLSHLIGLFLVVFLFNDWPGYLWHGGWLALYFILVWRAYLLCKMKDLDSDMVIQKGVTIIITFFWTLAIVAMLAIDIFEPWGNRVND